MARDFDWRGSAREGQYGLQGWRNRYDGVQRVGQLEWWMLIDGLRALEEQDRALSAHDSPPAAAIDAHRQRLLAEFYATTRKLRSRRKPKRLYVAHGRDHAAAALACAQLAHRQRFAYWLESFDAPRTDLPDMPDGLAKVLSAAALEMALLNASHVLMLDGSTADSVEWAGYLRARGMEHLPLEQRLQRWRQADQVEVEGDDIDNAVEGEIDASANFAVSPHPDGEIGNLAQQLTGLSAWLGECKPRRRLARQRLTAET